MSRRCISGGTSRCSTSSWDNTTRRWRLYDGPLLNTLRPLALNLCNASALLWRLDTLGCDVSDRWRDLLPQWEGHADGKTLMFIDLHAAMAELGSGQEALAERRLGWMRETAAGNAEAASCYREVGIPLVEGLMAFHRGAYEQAVESAAAGAVRSLAHRRQQCATRRRRLDTDRGGGSRRRARCRLVARE